MGGNGFGQLVADGQHRIQAGQRILEDATNRFATQLAAGFLFQVINALVIKADLATADAARQGQQSADRRAGQRFPRTGFANDAEDFPRLQREADLMQRLHIAFTVQEFHRKLLHFQQRFNFNRVRIHHSFLT